MVMQQDQAARANRLLSQPAEMTILDREDERSQARLGQHARAGQATEHSPSPIKVFPSQMNVPIGAEDIVSIGANLRPFAKAPPNFHPTPGSINVPRGNATVTVG